MAMFFRQQNKVVSLSILIVELLPLIEKLPEGIALPLYL